MMARAAQASTEGRLFDHAAQPFSRAGVGPWVFARMKLRMDPVYKEILKQGILPSSGKILDLGCGQALTLSAIVSAQRLHAENALPIGWQPPPRDVELCGFDAREKEVAIAQRALSDVAHIETADLRTMRLPACRAAVILDALHYMALDEQDVLLDKLASAIERGGTLLIREADAGGGAGFDAIRYSETFRARLRGHWRQRFHYRSADEWAKRLTSLGFETRTQRMGGRSPFRNVLVHGVRAPS